jgi:hypothetical protein
MDFDQVLKREEKIHWTRHSKRKMRYYRLSENRVKRVLRNPERKEVGVAPNTIAVMQTTGTKKNPKEIWMMYQRVIKRNKRTINIISAWRYPGKSPKGKMPPIPEDTLLELEKLIKNGKNTK